MKRKKERLWSWGGGESWESFGREKNVIRIYYIKNCSQIQATSGPLPIPGETLGSILTGTEGRVRAVCGGKPESFWKQKQEGMVKH